MLNNIGQNADNSRAMYNNFNNWTEKHTENATKTLDRLHTLDENLEKIDKGIDTIFASDATSEEKDSKLNEFLEIQKLHDNARTSTILAQLINEKEIGTSFDFMDGKDPFNEEEYDEQLTQIAYGDMLSKNLDDNDTINFEEYAKGELGELYGDEYSMEFTQEYFNSIDKDRNGELDLDEMKAFYESIDIEEDGVRDGKIKVDMTGMGDNDLTVTIDKWDANSPNNIDCPERLIRNIFGVELSSEKGQKFFQHLQEINPDLDLNNLTPDMVIKLID